LIIEYSPLKKLTEKRKKSNATKLALLELAFRLKQDSGGSLFGNITQQQGNKVRYEGDIMVAKEIVSNLLRRNDLSKETQRGFKNIGVKYIE